MVGYEVTQDSDVDVPALRSRMVPATARAAESLRPMQVAVLEPAAAKGREKMIPKTLVGPAEVPGLSGDCKPLRTNKVEADSISLSGRGWRDSAG